MAVPNDLSALNAIIENPWVTAVLLPIGYGLFRLFEYAIKRRMEGKPESERIDQYHKLVDLQEKLNKTGKTMADLDALRAHAVGDAADNAIILAQTYTTVAQRLVSDYEAVSNQDVNLLDSYNDKLTQRELNELSGQKAAQADDELATIIAIKLRTLDLHGSEALVQAQAAWETFRLMEVSRESQNWEGGSIRPLMANSRYEALTRERIALLSSENGAELSDIVVVHPKTPRNLFDRIECSVPREKVTEWLGPPSYKFGNSCLYRYEETQVEITFDSHDAVKEVVVALIHGKVYDGVAPGYAVSVPLGLMTLQDVLDIDEYATVEHFHSARTEEIYVRGRSGPSGAWTPFCFGALKVFSRAGLLQDTDFEWDAESGVLVSEPKDVLINWMAFGSDQGTFFSWFIK